MIEALYSRLQQRIARKYGEDIAQETFLKLCAAAPETEITDGWVWLVARNLWIDAWRHGHREVSLAAHIPEDRLIDGHPTPEQCYDAIELQKAVEAVMVQLTDKMRLALLDHASSLNVRHRRLAAYRRFRQDPDIQSFLNGR